MGKNKLYYPGLPGCILSLAPVWMSHEAVITASNDRFEATESLREKGHTWRSDQLRTLREQCTSEVQKRINEVEKVSNKFMENYDKLRRSEAEWSMNEEDYKSIVKKCQVKPVHLPGILATWSPEGDYVPSCLLDYCRFRILRPPMAKFSNQSDLTQEDQQGVPEWVIKKKIWRVDSCAEWAAFLKLASASKDNVSVAKASSW